MIHENLKMKEKKLGSLRPRIKGIEFDIRKKCDSGLFLEELF